MLKCNSIFYLFAYTVVKDNKMFTLILRKNKHIKKLIIQSQFTSPSCNGVTVTISFFIAYLVYFQPEENSGKITLGFK